MQHSHLTILSQLLYTAVVERTVHWTKVHSVRKTGKGKLNVTSTTYLLNSYYVPGLGLGAGNTKMNQTALALEELNITGKKKELCINCDELQQKQL